MCDYLPGMLSTACHCQTLRNEELYKGFLHSEFQYGVNTYIDQVLNAYTIMMSDRNDEWWSEEQWAKRLLPSLGVHFPLLSNLYTSTLRSYHNTLYKFYK